MHGPEILQEHSIYIHSAAWETMKTSPVSEIKDTFHKKLIQICYMLFICVLQSICMICLFVFSNKNTRNQIPRETNCSHLNTHAHTRTHTPLSISKSDQSRSQGNDGFVYPSPFAPGHTLTLTQSASFSEGRKHMKGVFTCTETKWANGLFALEFPPYVERLRRGCAKRERGERESKIPPMIIK